MTRNHIFKSILITMRSLCNHLQAKQGEKRQVCQRKIIHWAGYLPQQALVTFQKPVRALEYRSPEHIRAFLIRQATEGLHNLDEVPALLEREPPKRPRADSLRPAVVR